MNCAPFLASFANSQADQYFYGEARNFTMFLNGIKNFIFRCYINFM